MNQFEALLKMQIAMCEGWAKMVKDGFTAYERLVEHQSKIMAHPAYIRYHDVMPLGASWFDHYGKRTHDVDVEHI
jgi:hypothetical protein